MRRLRPKVVARRWVTAPAPQPEPMMTMSVSISTKGVPPVLLLIFGVNDEEEKSRNS